ncbi:hypothetical protein HZS_3369 [Henneguya salminicola]|nr:hypothetical protein HZS_3369 [Henneguya salminicola]
MLKKALYYSNVFILLRACTWLFSKITFVLKRTNSVFLPTCMFYNARHRGCLKTDVRQINVSYKIIIRYIYYIRPGKLHQFLNICIWSLPNMNQKI